MAGTRQREFHCTVVNEQVLIKLRSRRVGGFSGTTAPFVQCDQQECQHVDENISPCPLHLDLFTDEIAEQQSRRDAY